MYTLFETFVGAGGAHIGFKQNGFKSVYVNDFVDECLRTLVHNNPEINSEAYIDNSSIIDIEADVLFKKLGLKKKELDVMFGGIVCKGFSLAGDRSPNDERNYFYHKQLELVREFLPKISIIENVPGIINAKVLSKNTPVEIKEEIDKLWKEIAEHKGFKASMRKSGQLTEEIDEHGKLLNKKRSSILKLIESEGYLVSVIEDMKDIYEELGYEFNLETLNSAWYGAATKRERVIIVATYKTLKGRFEYPLPKFMDKNILKKGMDIDLLKLPRAKTVNEALSQINYGIDDPDNIPMNHKQKTIDRFKYIPEGENIVPYLDLLPEELKISAFYSRGSTMRLDGNSPSPTLVPGHSNFPVHPQEHRSITVREAAAISGFPIDYKFFGSHSKRCEHVGNAVPPPLASAIAEQCVKLLGEQE